MQNSIECSIYNLVTHLCCFLRPINLHCARHFITYSNARRFYIFVKGEHCLNAWVKILSENCQGTNLHGK
jgi:hypothetical protein